MAGQPRKLPVLFKRDRALDGERDGYGLTGYHSCWPDGQLIGVTFENFCKIGVRYLFGRDVPDRVRLSLCVYDLPSRDAPLPRVRPHRLRVLCLERVGRALHLLLPDGSPTHIAFHLDRDAPAVLEWLGAGAIADGVRQWFGFVAVPDRESGMGESAALP